MKIAYVYDAIYPYRIGGVEKRIFELSRRLAKRGHEIHIFGLKSWEGDTCFIKDAVHYHGLGHTRPFYINGRRSIGEAFYFGRKVFMPLLKENFDIIDCQNFPYINCFSVAFLAKLKGFPLVITWHEVWKDYWAEYLGISGLFGRYIEKMASRLSDNLITVSDLTKNDLISIRKGAKICIIPNGIEFQQINTIQKSEISSEIFFSGRLMKEKGADLLVRAMVLITKEKPQIRCIIAGDGPEKNYLQDLVKELKLEKNILFIGFLEHHDNVIAVMKSSRVFASPSTREGFGIAALEAMACGLQIVTINAPKNAVMELVNEMTGIICDPSPESFAEATLSCLKKWESMTDACKISSASYDWEKIVTDIENYYSCVSGIR